MPNFNAASTTTYTSSEQQIVTYSSATTQTYYTSTTGTAVVNAPLGLSPKVVGFMAPKGKCSQYIYPVTLANGGVLNLEITSTEPANVYLLSTYAYQSSADGCELTAPTSALQLQANFTEYTLRWAAPESGTFYIVLTGPTTVIMLRDAGSSQPVEEPANITYAVSTQTSFQDYAATNIDPITYTSTSSSQPFDIQPPTFPGFGVLALLGLCVSLAVVIVLALMRRR
jgi:hypothetical protein